MKKSIGKKVLFLMTGLGILLLLICLLNLAALSNISSYNDQLEKSFEQYREAAQSGDAEAAESTQQNYAYYVEHSNIRISGTEVFDFILIFLSIVLMVVITIVVKKSIADPAKNANIQLSDIVQKIEQNRGDLTERIQIKTKDEIGQLAAGINGFMEQLQKLMKKIQEESAQMLLSADEVTGQVDESNKSAMNVSAAT